MAAVRTATDYVSSHVVRFFARLICAVNSRRRKKQHAAKREVVAAHSADAETNRRLQLPFLPVQNQIYVIIFSTSTRVMEINYFLNTFNCWFLKGDFRI